MPGYGYKEGTSWDNFVLDCAAEYCQVFVQNKSYPSCVLVVALGEKDFHAGTIEVMDIIHSFLREMGFLQCNYADSFVMEHLVQVVPFVVDAIRTGSVMASDV